MLFRSPIDGVGAPSPLLGGAVRRADGAKAKKPGMMQNLTRGLGIYLLYFAITNGYKVLSDPKALNLTPGTREYWLSLVSNVIYLAAGLLAVWPWIKEWIEKRKYICPIIMVFGRRIAGMSIAK